MNLLKILLLGILVAASNVDAKIPRSQAAVAAFKHSHPCPATGKIQKSCPGYIVDHKIPLCAGGADDSSNMQWQPKAASLIKDKKEVAYCACLKRKPANSCTFKP